MSEPDLHSTLKADWEQTPLIMEVSSDVYKLLYQENRIFILRALNKGTIETTPFEYTRHSLTAQELLEFVQKNYNEDFKLTNVYFHLQKLIENKMIKEVYKEGTGKRPKTYYARTAKIFLNTEDMGYDFENDEFMQKFFIVISKLRPDLSLDDIKKPFFELNEFKWPKIEKILTTWFTENKKYLDSVDIDNTKLYIYLARLLDYYSSYVSFNDRILELLGLDEKKTEMSKD